MERKMKVETARERKKKYKKLSGVMSKDKTDR